MCGICGFVGSTDGQRLRRMTAVIRHRGPDDSGMFLNDGAGLGVRRLAIMDPAHGRQPVFSEDGRIVVVFNGEIYNAPDLRQELLHHGHRIRTQCDTEVLPHLFEEEGDDFVHRLEGQFAIAVWDRVRKRMLLSRDRLGIRPLYYTNSNGRLVFASEIKGVLAGLTQRPPISPEALSHYLSLRYVPSPLTILEGVRALTPGSQLTHREGRTDFRSYWHVGTGREDALGERGATSSLSRTRQGCSTSSAFNLPSPRPDPQVDESDGGLARGTGENAPDPAVAAQVVESMLTAGVRIRATADVPVGALLSGGVDSSLITALAARDGGPPLTTFTLGYVDGPESKEEELALARMLAETLGTTHFEYRASCDELLDDLPRILGAFDEPFAGVMSTYFISKLVARHVKVCLSGDGADELFGSYRSHRLAAGLDYGRRHGPAALARDPELCALLGQDLDRVVRALHDNDACWQSELFVFDDSSKSDLMTHEVLASAPRSTSALVREKLAACRSPDLLNRQLQYDCAGLLPDVVLNFSDKLAMAHAVEMRVPFLDHRLVEYVSTLPGDWKINGGTCKWLLKQIARRHLPEQIVNRPKEGFVMPLHFWQSTRMREAIESVLQPERLSTHGLFQPAKVRACVEAFFGGDRSQEYRVWTLYCFQVWYESVHERNGNENENRDGERIPMSDAPDAATTAAAAEVAR